MNEKMTAAYWQLNDKQWRFAEEYVIDLNITQAAIRAGYAEGSAQVQGSRLLTHAMVIAAVAYLIDERTKRTQINSDWVLYRLTDEVNADIADLYLDDGVTLKPVHQWPKIWRTGLISGIEVEPKLSSDGTKLYITKIKVSERIKRLELIGKHVNIQAFKDKIDIESDLVPWTAIKREDHDRSTGTG